MKNGYFYAQDAVAVAAALRQLRELRNACPELHWAALIDSAFDYPAGAELPYTAGSINCYQGDAFAGLQKAAPWLMPLGGGNDDEALLRSVLRHCGARPMVSIVGCRVPLDRLADHWRPLHRVRAVDEQRMLLRIADTRVLNVLPRILRPSQWAAYTAPLAHWLALDRTGKFIPLALAPQDTAADGTIALSQQQVDDMLLASQPDAVIDLLKDTMADIVPGDILHSDLYRMIHDSCTLAAKHGVQVFADTFALAVAACLTNGETNHRSEVRALLGAGQWRRGELGEELVQAGLV